MVALCALVASCTAALVWCGTDHAPGVPAGPLAPAPAPPATSPAAPSPTQPVEEAAPAGGAETTQPEHVAEVLDRLNEVRRGLALAPVAEDRSLSVRSFEAARYMVLNGTLTHKPEPGRPGYTEAAAHAAARSVLSQRSSWGAAEQGSPTEGVDRLLGGPYHAIPMLNPRLGDVGVGFYTDGTTAVVAIEVGTNRAAHNDSAAESATVTYPGPGAGPSLPAFGREAPNPLANCPGYYEGSVGSGIVYVAAITDHAVLMSAEATLRRNGEPVEVCVITAETDVNKHYLSEDQAILIPAKPLHPGGAYEVGLNWTDGRTQQPRHAAWAFNT